MDKTCLSTLQCDRFVKRIPWNGYLEICITGNWKRLDVNEQKGFSSHRFCQNIYFFFAPFQNVSIKYFFSYHYFDVLPEGRLVSRSTHNTHRIT
jgi:hypothetical protein